MRWSADVVGAARERPPRAAPRAAAKRKSQPPLHATPTTAGAVPGAAPRPAEFFADARFFLWRDARDAQLFPHAAPAHGKPPTTRYPGFRPVRQTKTKSGR